MRSGANRVLNRDLNAKHEQLSEYTRAYRDPARQLASARPQYDSIQVADQQQRCQYRATGDSPAATVGRDEAPAGSQYHSKNNLIGGIPVDSEYIIFVIDTSGSMFSYAWERMIEEIQATLSIYPEVKGIQVMNDMGKYMFSRYRGQWIPDTPGRRKVIMQNSAQLECVQ